MLHKHDLPRNDYDGKLITFAWPGGYPVYYLCKDGSVLCAECANKQEIANAKAQMTMLVDGVKPWLLDSEIIVNADINYEDCDLFCDDCNKQIESAYNEDCD